MLLTLTLQGAGAIQPLQLDRRTAMLGRSADGDMVLPASAVSSRHCRVDWQDGAYVLTDTSSNGTLLNGRPVSAPARLTNGDQVEIGPYRLGVTLSAAAGAMPPGPSPRMNLNSWDRAGAGAQPAPPAPALAASPTMRQPAAQSLAAPQLPPPGADAVSRLLHAAGMARPAVGSEDAAVLAAAGTLLRQLTAGTMTLLAARSKARSELAVPAPVAASGPLQQATTAEGALAQLLGHPQAAERAVVAAFADLAAHQQAILHATQGALRATLDNIAPQAIRERAGRSGKSDPATLWRAYEQAFAGAADNAGLIELFARELAAAYGKLAAPGAPSR